MRIDEEGRQKLLKKKVYIETTSGRKYTGIVDSVSGEGVVSLIDKYGDLVLCNLMDISLLEVRYG